jgi:hypothetical protein
VPSKINFDGIHHPEFRDENGNSRINFVNWNSYAGVGGSYPYETIMKDMGQLGNNFHGIHVAGIACGSNIGWAKKSSIYNISPYVNYLYEDYKYLVAIKNWHNSKGNSRPTVTNHSYGLMWPTFDTRYINSITLNGNVLQAPRETEIAEVECEISNGKISAFNIINPGSGYTNRPTVSYNGGGGDEAAIIMAYGSVKDITVTNVGSGYDPQNPPTVTFSSPGLGGETATGVCEVNGQGKISRIRMTDRGSGYVNPPTITFSSPTSGPTATATATIGSNFIKRIQVLNSVSVEPVPPVETWGDVRFRGGVTILTGDPPMLVISGGGCVKDALWDFTRDAEILSDWYGKLGPTIELTKPYGKITDGLYQIAEKVTELSPTSFKQIFFGGEYTSPPSVSFTYYQGGRPYIGQHALLEIENGEISYMEPLFAHCPSFGGLEAPGWFTSIPQVFITNGGGFTVEQLEGWGIRKDAALYADELPGLHLALATRVPARDPGNDSVVEDLMNSGVIVVVASGNSSWNVKDPNNMTLEVNFTYLHKSNPSIPYEDSLDFPFDFINYPPVFPAPEWPLTYYMQLYGASFNWSDNIYEIQYFQGSSPNADGVISTGSVSWECCPEKKSDFSNTGTRIDLYAAGDQVTSCSYYSNRFDPQFAAMPFASHLSDPQNFALIKLSGTSMASPQVCGAAACALTTGYSGPAANQQAVRNWLKTNSKSSLADLPFPHDLQGGTNKQLYFPGVTTQGISNLGSIIPFPCANPDHTQCPSGCCQEPNYFCCPDNINCAPTPAECP